ncbi:MAG: hypothetical protein V5B32_07460, partial [Candidatus Accumulibacter sp. UW26]
IRFLLSLSAGEDIIGFIGLLAWRGEDQAYHSNIWRLNQRFLRAFATDAFAHRHFWHSATCTNELDLVSGSAWMGVLADAMERIDVNWLESPRFCASITRVLDALEQPLQRLEKRASDSPWVKDELPKQREYFTEKIGYYGDLTPLIVGFVRYAKRANNRHLVLAIANSIGSLRRANEKIHGAVQSAQYLDEVVTRAISD